MIGVIREAFNESGWSIKQLSKRSNVPYASCHGLLTRAYDPNLSTVEKVCRVLGLKLSAQRPKRKGK